MSPHRFAHILANCQLKLMLAAWTFHGVRWANLLHAAQNRKSETHFNLSFRVHAS